MSVEVENRLKTTRCCRECSRTEGLATATTLEHSAGLAELMLGLPRNTGKVFAVCDPTRKTCMELHRADPTDESHVCRFAHGPRKKKPKPKPKPASAPRQTPQPAAASEGPAGGRRQQTQGAAFDPIRRGSTRRRDDGSEAGSEAGEEEEDEL